MVAAAAQADADVSCWQAASGAATRSTIWGFKGCAAGQSRRPRLSGAAREPVEAQESEEEEEAGGAVAPARHEAHVPEQAADVRPAELP